ncbi:flagellar basal body L-ring protein FlgH [Aliifodinibius sp. S!AR15-10]|uniref:flagellar basal body L-ring protein FlgH n=1 Tax=Aliifodinibius sp. S!AR15-10 TaxID=2950437 RepID=UPI002855A1F5|nr:flagellar basal body L-ring protein FlgH [Aliifodinibius sp. S!AR15-10]MDR8394231.1 flagellar basal body L-ring protein FlgH [Aliifodinibius sp. S!AR15-10]
METNIVGVETFFLTLVLLAAGTFSAAAQGSLYQDIKGNEVGDIITVVLREDISGSSTSDSESASNSAGSANGAATGNFLPFEPTFGSNVQVNYGSDQSAEASQRQLLEGYMSVTIAEETPRGDFVIEGTRSTEINGELHEMELKGTVRPRDINSRNQVYSFLVANAEISYQKKGGVRELTKERGFIRRVIFTGVGVALGAAITLKALN